MDPAILAQRNAIATNRLVEAAEVLADRFTVSTTLGAVLPRDPQVAGLFQREAVAELLEALVRATDPGQPLPDQTDRMDALTVAQLEPLIVDADLDTLDELEAAEQAGKNRKGVLTAIADRRESLRAESATPAAERDEAELTPQETLNAFREGLTDAEQEGTA